MNDRVERLTDAQKQVLRLLFQRRSASQIARDLDISINAVNERLRAARRTLDVGSSLDAAATLAASERLDPYKGVVDDPIVMASNSDLPPVSTSPRLFLPWRSAGRQRSDLTLIQTILLVIVMAVVISGLAGLYLIGIALVGFLHQLN